MMARIERPFRPIHQPRIMYTHHTNVYHDPRSDPPARSLPLCTQVAHPGKKGFSGWLLRTGARASVPRLWTSVEYSVSRCLGALRVASPAGALRVELGEGTRPYLAAPGAEVSRGLLFFAPLRL